MNNTKYKVTQIALGKIYIDRLSQFECRIIVNSDDKGV